METNPISVIFMKSDSKGDRLLFRFPFQDNLRPETRQQKRRKNPYALTVNEDLLYAPPQQSTNVIKGQLSGFSDEVLSTLFAVKQELCEHKFELKVNDVRFVSHPTLLNTHIRHADLSDYKANSPSIFLVNIVFALQAIASHSIVKCYYDLSKQLGIALRHEEQRCGYVSEEMKTMIAIHDATATRPEEASLDGHESPFDMILKQCSLARNLKTVYEDLSSSGKTHLRVNKWIQASFCLPQKVHQCHRKGFMVEPEMIDNCLKNLRPYHGILLLTDQYKLLETIPPDASPALTRLIKMYSPIKSLQTLSADADLTLKQIFHLVGHLLYWGDALIIYPICDSNVYVMSPDAPTYSHSPLIEQFSESFPGHNLLQVMSEFSLPMSMRQKISPLCQPHEQAELVQILVWLLQHRLLLQLHTYIFFIPTQSGLSNHQEQSGPSSHQYFSREERNDSFQSNSDIETSSAREPSESDISSNVSDDKVLNFTHLENVNYSSFDEPVDQIDGISSQEFLADFNEEERSSLLKIPACSSPEDFYLLIRLCKRGYLHGMHHLEEIMYLENVRRSQLLQILDKFRDVLITCEMEDLAISMFHSHSAD
ncbi:unnamed protein product [Bemisia tabaci]|uniref:GATOR complex protein NPRL3 n=1 Tax=Bemisia tabaci TaxID=7038 RepID=A0A9P0A907_BEMTA|nr:unnamed protein product [Bemisia tabaci]